MVNLPSLQAAVMSHVFNNAPVVETADTLDFRFSGEFAETFYAAHVAMSEASVYHDCSLVLTLATHSDIVFMGVTQSRHIDVARALGSLEDLDRETRAVFAGDVVRIPDPRFAALGWHAVVLLRPAVLEGFAELGDCWTINNRHLRFVLALFLTEDEYSFRKSQGHDALMDRFSEEQRSVVIFAKDSRLITAGNNEEF